MNSNFFVKSKNFTQEYCASIVKIGEIKPIEGADRIGQTFVNGESLVINKNSTFEGDILIYVSNECQLQNEFLSINNFYNFDCKEFNSNYQEIKKLIDSGKTEEAKRLIGFFDKNRRVRRIKLKGIPSIGCLFTKKELVKFSSDLENINFEDYLGMDFDMIHEDDTELFVKPYIPISINTKSSQKINKLNNKINKFDRIIPTEFKFHYDTSPLPKCIDHISPTDVVTCSVKLDGTSAIFANIKTKEPLKISFWDKIYNWTHDISAKNYKETYGNIYSSRRVIKNEFYLKSSNSGYYETDIWKEYNDLISPYI